MLFLLPSWLLIQVVAVHGYNFPYEGIQLTDADVQNYSRIAFGDSATTAVTPSASSTNCKVYPGDAEWPADLEWKKFNDTLGGVLIKGIPPASICYQPYYNATQCASVTANYYYSQSRNDDPVEIVNEWLDGDSCPPSSASNVTANASTCNFAAYPAYVVNATTVRHIQMAVNFARNSKIRLIIKNTGHDMRGQSAGAGSISIWTHHLKDFEYLPSFSIGDYQGKAARVAAGVQSFELSTHMSTANVTIVAPASTVGVMGGWFQGGGHSTYTSYYGLGADQILAIELVTADGRFVTADPNNNTDLFWALRGGGGGTYGVVTSAIMKAYDPVPVGFSSVIFSTANLSKYITTVSNETFWAGIRTYLKFGPQICDAGGIGYNFIQHVANGTLLFSTSITIPGMNFTQASTFTSGLFTELNNVGVNITDPFATPVTASEALSLKAMAYPSRGPGEMNTRLASRLFPRENFEDNDLLNDTLGAIRNFVEEGDYTFHGVNHCPTMDVAGNPDNAVIPAWRKAAIHAQGWSSGPAIGPIETQKKDYERFSKYFQPWRDVSPGAGSYMGEADAAEPDWQQSFYGDNYERLLGIKQKWDSWDLFWANTAVGSEGWAVKTPVDGWPTQNVSTSNLDLMAGYIAINSLQ